MQWKWVWHNNFIEKEWRAKNRGKFAPYKKDSEARKKIRGKFAPILEQWWEGQTKGANLPAGKKRGFQQYELANNPWFHSRQSISEIL